MGPVAHARQGSPEGAIADRTNREPAAEQGTRRQDARPAMAVPKGDTWCEPSGLRADPDDDLPGCLARQVWLEAALDDAKLACGEAYSRSKMGVPDRSAEWMPRSGTRVPLTRPGAAGT